MSYEYKVVPFIGTAKGNQGANVVADQLTALINREAAAGWELYQMGDVNIEVQPGCLAGLLGRQTSYMRFDQLVFRRASS